VFNMLKRMLRLLFPRHTVVGTENVHEGRPAVFVCNHAQSYGPIIMELYFPFKFRPWVVHNVTNLKLCADYLERDFAVKELKLRRPFSRWLAAVLAPLCIRVMKSAGAIPVFRGELRLRETFELTVGAVRQGDNIVIFPENPGEKYSEFIDDFHPGFVHLARLYYRETGKILRFYPVYADKSKKAITIGKPVQFSPENAFRREKEHIRVYLRDSLNEIALANK